mgnify:CR=1 FL=1
MKLEKKKNLVARTLGVGGSRVIFNTNRLSEIKEAITKQDIKDLVQSGAIKIKEIKGRLRKEKRKTRRRIGSIRKKVSQGKREYIIITRKLRSYLKALKKKSQINLDNYYQLRKQIKSREFKTLSQMKERIAELGVQK